MKTTQNKTKVKLTSQGWLLHAIFEKYGGIRACAAKLNVSPQTLVNWKVRQVPFNLVGSLHRQLEVPKAALNYEEVCSYEGKLFDWKTVIKQCNLHPEITKELLKMSAPKVSFVASIL